MGLFGRKKKIDDILSRYDYDDDSEEFRPISDDEPYYSASSDDYSSYDSDSYGSGSSSYGSSSSYSSGGKSSLQKLEEHEEIARKVNRAYSSKSVYYSSLFLGCDCEARLTVSASGEIDGVETTINVETVKFNVKNQDNYYEVQRNFEERIQSAKDDLKASVRRYIDSLM